jgi:hypothetical protein
MRVFKNIKNAHVKNNKRFYFQRGFGLGLPITVGFLVLSGKMEDGKWKYLKE